MSQEGQISGGGPHRSWEGILRPLVGSLLCPNRPLTLVGRVKAEAGQRTALRVGDGKRQLLGQIQPASCLCTACELNMVLTFLKVK